MVTMRDVRSVLDAAEVDYAEAASLGAAALPHLAELATGDDTLLAAKAVYLASAIGGDGSASIITEAAERGDPILRVAAVAALRNLESGGTPAPPAEDLDDLELGEDWEDPDDYDWEAGSRLRPPTQ
jgi:hypothetical protein